MRNKEEKAERAKQFLPFDSLKGYHDFLKQKERIIVKRKHLSQDTCELLDRKLKQIGPGKMVKIVYYDNQEYVELEGMVTKIDRVAGVIRIVDQNIFITTIIEMQGDCFVEMEGC